MLDASISSLGKQGEPGPTTPRADEASVVNLGWQSVSKEQQHKVTGAHAVANCGPAQEG